MLIYLRKHKPVDAVRMVDAVHDAIATYIRPPFNTMGMFLFFADPVRDRVFIGKVYHAYLSRKLIGA